MVSNSFSSPVILGMRVHSSFTLVHIAYTYQEKTRNITKRPLQSQRHGFCSRSPWENFNAERLSLSNFFKVPQSVTLTNVCHTAEWEEPCLGFHVVGDVVNGASQRDFSDRPGGVVGQVGGQDADPQLALFPTHPHTHTPVLCDWNTFSTTAKVSVSQDLLIQDTYYT